MDEIVVTGNFTDSPVALDMGQLLELPIDISDLVSLKIYANSEFCPRFIPASTNTETRSVGTGLCGKTVIICSGSDQMLSRNELAMRNLILARAAKDNAARRVVLIEPDLFFSAQDRGPFRYGNLEVDRPDEDLRKFDGQPFTSRLYAELLRGAGVDAVVTVHNHSRKVQELFSLTFPGAFHNLIPAEVYAHYIKTSDFAPPGIDGSDLVLCAPDNGAKPFVDLVWESLRLPKCKRIVMDKVRESERKVSMTLAPGSECAVEDLHGKNVVIFDDMVRTGTTIVECSRLLREGMPRRVCFVVTHFHPSQEARDNLNCPELDEILTTATIPAILNRDCQGRLRRKLAVLKLGKWIAGFVLQMLGRDGAEFKEDFYTVDMSSKNPRWKEHQ
jgi:ribose-phosphate pyrophosphokinase